MITAEDVSTIILSVIFVGTFLSIFYFTYVSKVENEIVKEQIRYLTDDFTKDISLLPAGDIKTLQGGFNAGKNFDAEDEAVRQHNKKIMMNTIYAMIGLNVVGIAVVLWLAHKYGFSVFDPVKKSLIVLVFIAFTEFTFLNLFVRNYISVDINSLKLSIFDKLTGSH